MLPFVSGFDIAKIFPGIIAAFVLEWLQRSDIECHRAWCQIAKVPGWKFSANRGQKKMIDVNLDFSGLQDITRDLQTLSKAENNKVLRDSTCAGADCSAEVIDRAPEKTGKLKKTLLLSPRKPPSR